MLKVIPLLIVMLFTTISCKDGDKKYKNFEPRELSDITAEGSFTTLWNMKLEKSKAAYGYTLSPFVDGKSLFVASQSGDVYKLDAETGSKLWSAELDMELSAGPGVGDERLILGSPEGQVVVLDKSNGSRIWSENLSSEILSTPIIYNGAAIVRTQDGRIYSLNAENGERNWFFDTNIPNLTLRGNSQPLVKAGRIFVGFDNGKVAAIQQESGEVIWLQNVVETDGKTELARIVDIDGEMALIATDLYLSSAVGKTISVATESGRVMWSVDHGSSAGVSASRSNLFVVDQDSSVMALNRANGETVWKNTDFKYRQATKPNYYLGDVLFGDLEGFVHIVDGSNGTTIARKRVGKDEFFGSPVVSGNMVYAYNKDGTLQAFSYSR